MTTGRDPSSDDGSTTFESEWGSPFSTPGKARSGSAGASFGRYRGPAEFLALPWADSTVGPTRGESFEAYDFEDAGEAVEERDELEELEADTNETETYPTEAEWSDEAEWEAEDTESTLGEEERWAAPGLQDEEAPFDPEAAADEGEADIAFEEPLGEMGEMDVEAGVDETEGEWGDEAEGPGWADEWEEEQADYEDESSGGRTAVGAGKVTIAKVPLLRRHEGVGPDLILLWNDVGDAPSAVDVVVHLHGYSLRPGSRLHIERDLLARSGLDWSDPKGADSSPGRTRPTLALLPRGHFFGGNSRRGYTFPALMANDGLRKLVDFGLRKLAERVGVAGLALDRLILTAHSGGAAALLRIVKSVDPHEVHVFDGLYQSATALIDWATSRIARDKSALKAGGEPVEEYMARRGGALRVIHGSGTARYSAEVASALSRLIQPDSPLRRWYRVERTATGHLEIPPVYGWRLLGNAAADLPGVPFLPSSRRTRAKREAEDESFETVADFENQVAAPSSLRAQIVQVANDEWNRWGQGTKNEADPSMSPVLQEYYRVGVGRSVSASDLQNKKWQYDHPWSAVFISYVMRKAGAGAAFEYAAAHTTYACAATKARASGNRARFWAYRISEAQPEVGDLVCKDRQVNKRCSGTTYETLCAGGKSHCDVVVEIDRARNRIRTIGGNVDQSVKEKTIALDPNGYLPPKAKDGCRWIAVLKPPGGAVATGDGAGSLLASLPGRLADAVRQGAISMQVALAILTGQRDPNTLTNLVFYAKHPELPVGYKIQPHEKHLVQHWLEIKQRIIGPLLQALGPAPTPGRSTSGAAPSSMTSPSTPRPTSASAGDDRAYKYHSKLGGYSRYGGGRLETRLRELRDQGRLSISDGDIELLQRISHVETGGCLQALNSWDDVYMSIGFMQWPMVFGKLQRLIARAPEAFKRYGIELDPTRRYSIKRSYGTETPIALKGVSHPRELRSLEWGKRFWAAGLDPEIVAREAALALEMIAEERRKIEKSLGRSIPHYDESSALRALIQETNNHRPAWLRTLLKRAVARYVSSGASTAAQFLDLVRTAIREYYPEAARATASKSTSDPKKIAEAVARMVRSGENLINKTGTLHMKGGCSA